MAFAVHRYSMREPLLSLVKRECKNAQGGGTPYDDCSASQRNGICRNFDRTVGRSPGDGYGNGRREVILEEIWLINRGQP
jgi:hypothetical protein